MSYSNGVITLIPGTYKVTIYMNKYTASSNQFNTLQLMNTTTNTALFTSLYSWNAQAS